MKITVNSSQENPQKVQDSVKTKRAKQNVVLQSIFKKMEENKQACRLTDKCFFKKKFINFRLNLTLRIRKTKEK